uniref:beta strand repeat-containing protein n=1 Tax=Sandarakinorhabdus oryzae TaxID=2675220 RepID=UPI0012E0FFAC
HRHITHRRQLLAGAGALALLTAAAPGLAQVAVPSGGTLRAGAVEFGFRNGQAPNSFTTAVIDQANQITRGNNNQEFLTIRVGSNAAIIDWQSFNIGRSATETGTVTFANNNGGNPFAVLNRVTGGSNTAIDGLLQGSGNAANGGMIWVVNPNGVIFGPQSSVTNMSGFVASTLGVSNTAFTDFVNGGAFASANAVPFTNVAGGPPEAGIIRLSAGTGSDPGADITGINGVVLLVARRIDIEKGAIAPRDPNITAGGDIGFVVARSASVQLTQNSLIQMNIAEGSDLANGQLIAGGIINGARVFAAVANRATLTESLLNVTGTITATHAVATEKGIVLRAGTPDAGGQVPIAMPAAPADNAVNDIAMSGTLTASGSSIDVAGNRAVGVNGLTSGGNVTVTGGSGAGSNVSIGAGGITAARAISVTAANGNISTAGGTLRSNSGDADFDAGTARGITLTASGSIGTQGSGPALITGVTAPAGKLNDVSVTVGNGSAVNLGAITARNLTIDSVSPGAASDIRLGNVSITSGLTLSNAGLITTGSLVTGGSVALTATGALTTGSIDNSAGTVTLAGSSVSVTDANSLSIVSATASNGAVLLNATTGLTASGDITAKGGGVTLSGTSLSLAGVGATGNIIMTTAGAVTATDVRARGGITINDGAASGPTGVTADRIEANGNITIFTTGALTVNDAGGFGTRDALLNDALTAFDGATGQKGNMTLTADSYAVGNSIVSTQDLSFTRTAGGALDISNLTFTAARDLTVANAAGLTFNAGTGSLGFTRSLTLTGALTSNRVLNFTASDTSGTIRFNNNVTLASGGALTLSAGNIDVQQIIGQAGSGAISLTEASNGGTIKTGSIDSRSTLTLSSTGPGAAITLTGATSLTATGAVAITGPMSINNGLTVQGTSVTMNDLTTRNTDANAGTGDVSITATTGNVSAGSLASRGALAVAADTAAATVGIVGATAAQGITVTAGGAAT